MHCPRAAPDEDGRVKEISAGREDVCEHGRVYAPGKSVEGLMEGEIRV
jgi:hypothetical protein